MKYQKVVAPAADGKIMTIKPRYNPLDRETSVLTSLAVRDSDPVLEETSVDFRFAATVAALGMKLKDSEFGRDINDPMLLELAKSGRGTDNEGYRAEFIRLLEMAQLLKR